jgi:hypothetical protein
VILKQAGVGWLMFWRASAPAGWRGEAGEGSNAEIFRDQISVLTQAVAGSPDLDDDGMVQQPVEQRGSNDGMAKEIAPFGEAAIDVLADSLAIAFQLSGDRRNRQPLPVQIQDHNELPQSDHRPARRSGGIIRVSGDRRAAAPPGAPREARRHTWGIFKRRFWGQSLRHRHLKDDLLRRMFEALLGKPAPMRQRPMTAVAVNPAMAQQE